ncbi:MAG: hypothetical protein ACKPKO_29410, partial [Candidatus Fonsibacter sp.]
LLEVECKTQHRFEYNKQAVAKYIGAEALQSVSTACQEGEGFRLEGCTPGLAPVDVTSLSDGGSCHPDSTLQRAVLEIEASHQEAELLVKAAVAQLGALRQDGRR